MKIIKQNEKILSKAFVFKALTFETLLLITLLTLIPSQFAKANSAQVSSTLADWKPVASDKLIKLPANIIEKRIQKDFQASAMATRMVELDSDMKEKVGVIKSILQTIPDLEGEMAKNQRFELLQYKSEYLDLLQESHGLHQRALGKKQDLYSNVLDKMRLQSGKISRNESYQIQQAQIAARQRMEKVVSQVDQSLMHLGVEKSSPYSDEYSKNLDQIEKLKMAINRHQTNESPQVNGVDISSEEYLRQLLMSVSTEQSLLDQEALMLSYMAKLVALDAQALEYEMAYGDEEDSSLMTEISKPSSVTTLFYQA